jgi:hypothetical protein
MGIYVEYELIFPMSDGDFLSPKVFNFGQHILNIERKAGNAERNQRTSSNKNKIYCKFSTV